MLRSKIMYPAILLCFFMFSLTGCENNSPQNGSPKMAVVDLGRLMRDSAPGKEGLKFIEAQQKEMQAQLDVIQDKLEKNPQDENAMQELQKLYGVSQQRIQAEGQNVASHILDVVQRCLNSFLEKNGYDIIIGTEALAAYNTKIDVTNQVLAEIDKQKIEFKPITNFNTESASEQNSEKQDNSLQETPAQPVTPPAN